MFDFKGKIINRDIATKSPSVLEVSHVSKRFGKFQALKDVSFTVPKNGKALLLGPNGAGKSTMIKAVMGVHRFAGTITVDGVDVSKKGVAARGRIGYVPQYSAFYENLTVDQEANFIAKIKGASKDAIQEKLAIVGLTDATKKTMKALSGGMRQRFALGMALLTNPPMLIFDEPLANIDLKGQLDFLGLVRNLALGGHTLLIATHLTGLSEFADQVVVLNRGRKIAEGNPDVLLNQSCENAPHFGAAAQRVIDSASRPPAMKIGLVEELNHPVLLRDTLQSLSGAQSG